MINNGLTWFDLLHSKWYCSIHACPSCETCFSSIWSRTWKSVVRFVLTQNSWFQTILVYVNLWFLKHFSPFKPSFFGTQKCYRYFGNVHLKRPRLRGQTGDLVFSVFRVVKSHSFLCKLCDKFKRYGPTSRPMIILAEKTCILAFKEAKCLTLCLFFNGWFGSSDNETSKLEVYVHPIPNQNPAGHMMFKRSRKNQSGKYHRRVLQESLNMFIF